LEKKSAARDEITTRPVNKEEFLNEIEEIQSTFKKPHFKLEKPEGDFPELLITVPDSWPHVRLRPLYDVHIGNKLHAGKMFKRDMERMVADPYMLSWDGGDLIENAIIGSPGIWEQREHPAEQFLAAAKILAPIQHKLLLKIPGNHEARTARVCGFDVGWHLAKDLKIPYFSDYCFLTIRYRGNNFRGVIHHGSGAAATPGGQRNAARKDMPWARADFYWTGHLHNPLIDPVFQTDVDQKTGRIVSRCAMVIISPSYLEYFGGYAATKRYGPSIIGATEAKLYPNGDIATEIIVKGKRL
jgi:hypothetical protein